MIKPTIGRIVWYHPPSSELDTAFVPAAAICAAIVAYVHSDTCVNLTVFDANSNSRPKTSVTLVQEGDDAVPEAGYCEWMPYQKGQAAKTEQLEKQIGAGG
jgi:hypothetical protein